MDPELRTIGDLAATETGPCMSLFLAATPPGSDADWHRLRVKKLLQEAGRRLGDHGLSAADTKVWTDAAARLCDGNAGGAARAVYVAGERTAAFELVVSDMEDVAIVGSRFRLAPVLAERLVSPAFVLLAVDKDQPRLFAGTLHGLKELTPSPPLPTLEELARHEEQGPVVQRHEVGPSSARHGVVHGHGGTKDVEKDLVERWLRALDRSVTAVAADNLVLVLAGVEWQVATFRRVSAHPVIADDALIGSPAGMSDQQLRDGAAEAARGMMRSEAGNDLGRLERLYGTDRVTTDPSRVARFARDGRVQALFIDPARDLLDDAVDEALVSTWRAGGAVHLLDGVAPAETGLVALLRW